MKLIGLFLVIVVAPALVFTPELGRLLTSVAVVWHRTFHGEDA